MNINLFELKVQSKTKTGNSYSRHNRKNNLIPCNIYSKTENIMGLIDKVALEKALNSKTLFNQFTKLTVDEKEYLVYAKVLQKHPVTEKYMHIDFIIVKPTDVIKMKVPVQFINKDKCEVIKLGAVLNVIHSTVLMEGKVEDMINYLTYDLAGSLGKESLLLSHIKFSDKVTVAKSFKSNILGTILNARKKGNAIAAAAEAEKK